MDSSADSKVLDDDNQWVIVQLSPTGEKEPDIDILRRAASRLLRREDVDMFIPAISQKVRDDSQTLFFMEGYVFFRFISGTPYLKLRDTTYFSDVLTDSHRSGGAPRYSLLPDSKLNLMRQGMDDLRIGEFVAGDDVKIIEGNFKNLKGQVLVVYDQKQVVQVSVVLRSKTLLMDFPSTYLKKI